VTATSGGVSQTVEVEFTGAAEVETIVVSANPTSILADGASTSSITALLKTADNQVVEGASVTFTTTRGAITSPHVSDVNGQAKATLTSERYFDSSVKVTARCQGKEAYTFVQFTGVTLTLTATPQSLVVGDPDGSLITATLKDAAGNPIANATVTFSKDKGTITPSTPQTTNSAGQATVTLKSNVSGTAKVTAAALGATGEVSVNFTRYLFTLEADPTTIRVGGEISQITATLLDQGVPKAGQTISFSTTLGTLSPYQNDTGADGKAVVTLTSGSQSGIAVIDADTTITDISPSIDLTTTTQVVITGGDAAKIVLTADPDIISVNTGSSTITANVYDANDQPAPNQQIYFRINTGPGGGEYLSASVKTTNSFGMATVTFYAGSLPSTLKGVEIEANTASNFSGSYGLANLTIAGPVANIGVGMNLETLEPDGGNLKIDISGIATDVNGNPVADGTKIYFAVTAIEFNEDRAHDLTIDCWDVNRNPLIPCPLVGTPGFGFTWFSDDVNQDGTMYSLGGPMSTTEDVNHNGILDPGEDKNDNGVIDPIQGCVIDNVVGTTDGVAKATLVYPMPQANNIKVRITAEAGGVSNFYETILLCTETMVTQGTCGIAY
jgi:adhesin/invasin